MRPKECRDNGHRASRTPAQVLHFANMVEPEPEQVQSEQPDQEQIRELEEEIRKLRVEDVILQGAVSILNLSARRIAKEDERDLEQAKVGIDAARALAELVPEEARPQLRQAVSELQLLYAKHAGEPESEPEKPKHSD
jgi:hypothetical protein